MTYYVFFSNVTYYIVMYIMNFCFKISLTRYLLLVNFLIISYFYGKIDVNFIIKVFCYWYKKYFVIIVFIILNSLI